MSDEYKRPHVWTTVNPLHTTRKCYLCNTNTYITRNTLDHRECPKKIYANFV